MEGGIVGGGVGVGGVGVGVGTIRGVGGVGGVGVGGGGGRKGGVDGTNIGVVCVNTQVGIMVGGGAKREGDVVVGGDVGMLACALNVASSTNSSIVMVSLLGFCKVLQWWPNGAMVASMRVGCGVVVVDNDSQIASWRYTPRTWEASTLRIFESFVCGAKRKCKLGRKEDSAMFDGDNTTFQVT
jgi:hypothetical protein